MAFQQTDPRVITQKWQLNPLEQYVKPDKNNVTLKNWDQEYSEQLIRELSDIMIAMAALESDFGGTINAVSPTYKDSARNLLHYLALRMRDVRELQQSLASLGLSSLGRSESHVMANISAVLDVLMSISRLCRIEDMPQPPVDYEKGGQLLEAHTIGLLGPSPPERNTHIMVTMPDHAAYDYALVRDLLAGGMDCMRINCAYGAPKSWTLMLDNLRKAEKELGKKCRVFMDLAGHKLRIGPIENVPPVIKWGPRKDPLGRDIAPARIWLTPSDSKVPPPAPVDACIHVPADWLNRLSVGDTIELKDTRGKLRSMSVAAVVGECRICEADKGAYVTRGTVLRHKPADGHEAYEAVLTDLPAKEQFIVLARGDTIILTKDQAPGKPPVYDERGQVIKPAIVSVTMPEIFSDVRVGERIWFDDGKIGGIVRFVNGDQIHADITHARYHGERLRSNKGINLPDSDLRLSSLTKKDLEDLKFIAKNADIVGFSFVNSAADVFELQSRLAEYGGRDIGIVLKIETLKAFEHLPNLILAAMRSPHAGVMIARGDLAVECGYERLAEVQEEILWFCEAAHMPVIWATQVLEKLAKKGMPSRAEITDAAMSVRAECVMLNKGPYIVDAIRILDDILTRMQAHQDKKSSMMRQLNLAHSFNTRAP